MSPRIVLRALRLTNPSTPALIANRYVSGQRCIQSSSGCHASLKQVSGGKVDRAAINVHDIGLRVYEDAQQPVFDVIVGGGLGRTPADRHDYSQRLPAHHPCHLHAIPRVYNRYGRRDNKYKARIKILLRALGAEAFTQRVDEEWQQVIQESEPLADAAIAKMQGFFQTPTLPTIDNPDFNLDELRLKHPQFSRWIERNVSAHQSDGYANVILSTKAPGVPPGDVSAEQMLAVADWADQFGSGEVRISHEQNFALPHIRQQDLFELCNLPATMTLPRLT